MVDLWNTRTFLESSSMILYQNFRVTVQISTSMTLGYANNANIACIPWIFWALEGEGTKYL